MAHTGETVIDDVALRLVASGEDGDTGDDGLLLRATLRYDPADPFAVQATFWTGEESVSWVLARDLLSDGLLAHAGVGDVRVWPQARQDGDPGLVLVELTSPDGQATLAVDATDLGAFLLRTFEVVPQGCETDFLDLDNVLARLLG